MTAPPMTSEAWWACRWTRDAPIAVALASRKALPARSPGSESTVAAAEGGEGVATREAARRGLAYRHPAVRDAQVRAVGAGAPDDRLDPGVDHARRDAGDGEGTDRLRPLRSGSASAPGGNPAPQHAAVPEPGDRLGRGIPGRSPTERLEPPVHPLVEGMGEPDHTGYARGCGRRPVVGHPVAAAPVPSAAAASDGSPPNAGQ